jgi:polyhydroxyalkanoate synthesis regulator phasin
LQGVAEQREQGDQRGVSESLRTAIERTFAATAESAAGTRDRAGGVLDEVSKRGRGAREAVAGRAQEARESSGVAANRVIEAIEGMRLASRDEVRELSRQLDELAKRVAALEDQAQVKG